jgi:adenylosuccinate synthase
MIDLFHDEYLRELLERNVAHANKYLKEVLGSETKFEAKELLSQLEEAAERLRPFVTNVSLEVDRAVKANRQVVFEGAQGTLLDIVHGTYPFVTSSNTAAGYACASAGLGPNKVDMIVGICKAYCTRVGSGPFPTEDKGQDGEILRKNGVEFGTVTGRPRRCGWFDAMAVRRANRVNGVDRMIITKLDVLSGFETLKLGVGYKLHGQTLDDFPASWIDVDRLEVEYEEMPGWQEDITGVRSFDDLPVNAQKFLSRLEELTQCWIAGFSVGPDRVQTIMTDDILLKRDKS